MFKDKLEDIFNSKRQTVTKFVPTFKVVPIFTDEENPLDLLETCGIKTTAITEFFSFYSQTLFNFGMIPDNTFSLNYFGSLNSAYVPYVPSTINFESYIDVAKNRYLVIYNMKTSPLMRHCATNFQIVFEYKKFNQDPTILVFPRWQDPVRNYHQLCEQMFENLYDVFNYVNRTDDINILDIWTAMRTEKEFFDQIAILHQINTI